MSDVIRTPEEMEAEAKQRLARLDAEDTAEAGRIKADLAKAQREHEENRVAQQTAYDQHKGADLS